MIKPLFIYSITTSHIATYRAILHCSDQKVCANITKDSKLYEIPTQLVLETRLINLAVFLIRDVYTHTLFIGLPPFLLRSLRLNKMRLSLRYLQRLLCLTWKIQFAGLFSQP